ncbi:unnamed protein product, partial [Linum tenue]
DLVAIPHGLKLIDKTIETKDSELRGFESRYGLLMLVGALLAGLLINYGGRRWPFAFGIVVYTVGSAVVSFGSRMATYRVGRSFMTIGTAIGVVIGPIYIAEVAPARVRGFLGSFPQLLFCVGRVCGYAAQYAIRQHSLHNRGGRVMTGIPCVVSLITLVIMGVSRFRESPAYLPIEGLLEESRSIMEDDMGCPRQEADERIEQLKKVANISPNINHNTDHYNRKKGGIDGMWSRLFNGPTLLILFLLHILYQLSGEFLVLTYARPILIRLGGLYSEEWYIRGAATLTGARIMGSLVLMLAVDWLGRRKMMLTSTVITMLAAVVLGVVGIGNQHGCISDGVAFHWLAWGAVAFEAGLSVGFGGILWMYGPESIGLPSRGLAVTGAVLCGLVVGKLINVGSLSIYGRTLPRAGGAMLISAGFMFVAVVLTFLFMKDTSKKPLRDHEPSSESA